MLIEEAFKIFTENTLKEPINKGKKNHDLCIEVYSKAQLIDLSAVYLCNEDIADSPISMDIYEAPDKFTSITKLSSICEYVNLPFEVCFFKLYDTTSGFEDPSYLFIREFAPQKYTGALLVEAPNKDILKSIFYISEDKLNFILTKGIFSEKHTEYVLKTLGSKITRALMVINRLSPKNHNIYKVAPEKTEYLRKKVTKEVIKVQRPVYIYLNKDDKENKVNPTKNYKPERIERNFGWLVRGHWRRLDNPHKRGKDSQGNYVVEGFTWVKPHICGNPEFVDNRTYVVMN